MAKKRHKPPSRIRYEKTHPVISVRMPKKWIDDLDAYLDEQGLSRGDFYRISLGKQKANYRRAYIQGYNKGYNIGLNAEYEKGMQDWGIQFPCRICGELVYIPPNSDCHKAIIEFLRECGWAHAECREQ